MIILIVLRIYLNLGEKKKGKIFHPPEICF